MLFRRRPSWESYLWCGRETQGPFLTSTAPHCGLAPIGTMPSSLGQTLNLELGMVARCTLSTLGHLDGPVICEGGQGGVGLGRGGGGAGGGPGAGGRAWRGAAWPGDGAGI